MITEAPPAKSPSGQDDTSPNLQPSTKRSVKSFRLREDLCHQIEVSAVTQRKKIYQVVEEALEQYLAAKNVPQQE